MQVLKTKTHKRNTTSIINFQLPVLSMCLPTPVEESKQMFSVSLDTVMRNSPYVSSLLHGLKIKALSSAIRCAAYLSER